jgi:hypothetical protein
MPSDPPDPAAALEALLPRLRRIQIEGWALLIVAAAIGVAGVLPVLGLFARAGASGATELWGILAGLGFVGLTFTPRWSRRRQEALILPALASAMDLAYEHSPRAFIGTLPGRLLPGGGRKSAEDMLSGKLAGRTMRFAEVLVETGGKNSRTLFDGIVIELPLARELPSFFVAAEKETEGRFGLAGNLGIIDLVRLDTVTRQGMAYGVWSTAPEAADHPGFRAVLDVLTDLGGVVGPDATLYSALCDRRVVWLAFRQKRDLFRIGGLLATRASMFADLQRASEDMSQPLRLISALIEAETKAAEAGAAPLAP